MTFDKSKVPDEERRCHLCECDTINELPDEQHGIIFLRGFVHGEGWKSIPVCMGCFQKLNGPDRVPHQIILEKFYP